MFFSVPDEDYYVPDEGYYVPDEGYYVPDEGYYVPDEGYYVPDEGYSRNASCALNLIHIKDKSQGCTSTLSAYII